jgi:hypothetical protein
MVKGVSKVSAIPTPGCSRYCDLDQIVEVGLPSKIGAGSRTREPGPDLSVPHPPKDADLGRGRHYPRSIMARSGQNL